jgi:hypothetical protein
MMAARWLLVAVLLAACGQSAGNGGGPDTPDGGEGGGSGSTSRGGSGGSSGSAKGGGGSGAAAGTAGDGAAGDGAAGDGAAGNSTQLVDCDPGNVVCKSMAPTCDGMEVPSVAGTCWGPCVRIERCACASADECPEPEQYTCWSSEHCGPFVR